MIKMNQSHPSFDLDMEILCTIPFGPSSCAMADLVNDFGLANQEALKAVFERLYQNGLPVRTFNSPQGKGRHAMIPASERKHVQEQAEKYWNLVNAA